MTRRTAQELKELRDRIATLERAGLKASAQALRDKLPRERVIVGGRRTGKTTMLRRLAESPVCLGFEIEPGGFSGCDQSGGDCPVCGK